VDAADLVDDFPADFEECVRSGHVDFSGIRLVRRSAPVDASSEVVETFMKAMKASCGLA
jgi:hypothetical protein